ncbi:MAG: hypothetical protein ISP45_26115 [Reyranella sp.]|nr:hypothetical protein [Reyranella sp.]
MSVQAATQVEEEPPLTTAQQVAATVSRGILYFLCIAPIALFPVGLAYKAIVYFFYS